MLTFALLDAAGAPLLGASPSFLVYKNGKGEARPAPVVQELGGGLYGFQQTADDAEVGVAYMIDCGVDTTPRYVSGSVGLLVACGFYTDAGVPWASSSPTLATYRSRAGVDLEKPPVASFGSGLYGFQPSEKDQEAGAAYVLQGAAGANPTHYSGAVPAGDVLKPEIANFDPPPGTAIKRGEAVSFDVSDRGGALRRIYIASTFAGRKEVVHDGGGFAPLFAGSKKEPIPGGFRFTIRRDGGWPMGSSPLLSIEATDSVGNIA